MSDAGTVAVSDALGQRSLRVSEQFGAVAVGVCLEPHTDATHVDIVIA